jgi:dephospho-CoA kinase
MTRLIQNRKMSESEARQRITAQPSQEAKLAAATVVIKNVSSFTDTWKQVSTAWQRFVPGGTESAPPVPVTVVKRPEGEMAVLRGGPRQSNEIAELMNRILRPKHPYNQEDVMAAFGEKAFLLLQVGNKAFGLVGWQVENLVSRAIDLVIDPIIPPNQALPTLLSEMERASKDLQCEAALVFASPDLANANNLWQSLGYERVEPAKLEVRAWQEAASESMPANTVLFFKKLRQDRILRPI